MKEVGKGYGQKEDAFVTLAVCGLHMRSFPFEKQLLDMGARFLRTALTAECYRIYRLDTRPQKPGLLRVTYNGCSIEVEIWKMPMERFGDFVAGIPAPLSFGKIELKDGEKTEGFLCEAYACRGAEDISRFGGWRAYVKSI